MTDIEVPSTTIPPAPRHQDQLLKMEIEEQRILIEAAIEVVEAQETIQTTLGEIQTDQTTAQASLDAAAVHNASAALEAHHETKIFPDPPQTDVCVEMVAGAVANTFGDWVEITDTGADTLSSKFASNNGYIVSVVNEDFDDSDKVYLVEISYGAAKTIIGRTRIQSGTNKTDTANQERMRSLIIPTGETIYYRCASEVALSTICCHIRYYLVPS